MHANIIASSVQWGGGDRNLWFVARSRCFVVSSVGIFVSSVV